MEDGVSKLRAIQIVLASVPMSRQCSDQLIHTLQNLHMSDEIVTIKDAQFLAEIRICIDDLEVNPSWDKRALVGRIGMATKRLRRILEASK